MKMENQPSDITSIINLISSLTALTVAIFAIIKYYLIPKHVRDSLKADTQKLDAEASKTFEEAAMLASQRANALEIRLSNLEAEFKNEIDRLGCLVQERDEQIKSLIEDIRRRDATIEQLKDWSERLVHQVQSLGGVPVSMEAKKKSATKK